MTGFALPGLRDENLELLPLSRRNDSGHDFYVCVLFVSSVARASEPVGGIAKSNARPRRTVLRGRSPAKA
jgi:hypothetical protein